MNNLTFTPAPPGLKRATGIWLVQSNASGFVLGQIRWFGRWRKYCFFPEANTTFDTSCLIEIADKIEREMQARKGQTIGLVDNQSRTFGETRDG